MTLDQQAVNNAAAAAATHLSGFLNQSVSQHLYEQPFAVTPKVTKVLSNKVKKVTQ